MAFRAADYPKDWERLRAARLAYAGNRCEGTPDHPDCRAENGRPHPETGSPVCLTIAHMCQTKCRNFDHLRALCNRCHLHYDAKHHAHKARKTRQNRAGVVELIEREEPIRPEAAALRGGCR